MGNVCAEKGAHDPGMEITNAAEGRSEHVTSKPPSYDTDTLPAKAEAAVTERLKSEDEEPAKALEVVFTKPDGQDISIFFRHKPLGMDFRTGGYPITIQNVKGVALDAGVKCGWMIKTVNGAEAAAPSGSFDDTLSMLRKNLEPLPRAP
mmetsp:Transcript_12034/g.22088  ORF Transcript_12034/g.22088 Transcript_12034/m.22088 type:complete len:149 (+) Transcript_12034:111-557(+)